jgi:predicted transcriptional regulator
LTPRARKDLGYSLKRMSELLLHLLASEAQGRTLGYMELQRLLSTDFKTVQRYVQALEENGWVKVEAYENKNVIKLTDRGRCIARCLVS